MYVDEFDTPSPWQDDYFLPYDWGYFAFVYDKEKLHKRLVPSNFRELAQSPLKIIIQDPRSSTPGLGLVLWVKAAYGHESARIWRDLQDNIVTVTQGWSEAYGLFLEGQSDMVLSYTTSPSYHAVAEGSFTKDYATFSEGHYAQVEVAAITKHSKNKFLAQRFLAFMLSPEFQNIIPTGNWMYPARFDRVSLPEYFETKPRPSKGLLFEPAEAARIKKRAVREWQRVLSR